MRPTPFRHGGSRALRIALGAAGALTLTVAVGISAQADPLIPDPTKTGTLNIVKYEGPETGTRADGTINADPGGKPVAGVTFSVTRITAFNGQAIDLTTSAGWELATALDAAWDGSAPAPATVTTGTAVSGTTDANGVPSFGPLAIGLYWVQETYTPPGVVPSQPFLVTIPMTDPTGTTWMYDVYAFPKNDRVDVTKTVNTAGALTLGSKVNYEILAAVPQDGDEIDAFVIADLAGCPANYDPTAPACPAGAGLLSVNASDVVVSLTGLPTAAGITLDPATDFTVAAPGIDPGSGDATYFTVEFTAAGLTKLENADKYLVDNGLGLVPGVHVKVTYAATIQSADALASGQAGLFVNSVNFYPSVLSKTDNTPTSDNDKFATGVILLKKVDGNDASKALDGAQFTIYAANADGTCSNPPAAGTGPIAMQVSDGQGFKPLSATPTVFDPGPGVGFYHSGQLLYGNYCVVETVAPTGYELQTEPIPVTVGASTDTQLQGNSQTLATAAIKNFPHNAGFDIPFTGDLLQTGIAVFGLLALGGGTYVYLRALKQAHAQ